MADKLKDDLQIVIHHKAEDKYYIPAVVESARWETSWKGAPGRFTFTILKDEIIQVAEGDVVQANYQGTNFFYGFVFSKKRDKNMQITITAYDQLRYLKNKSIYVFTEKTASEMITAIAKDFMLKTGSIADTAYVIPKYRGSNQCVLDIIQDLLDMTTENCTDESGNKVLKLYVLYDDFGELTLKELDEMQTNILIDNETAQNFAYESTIDKETYNKVVLVYDDKEKGVTEAARAADPENIAQWGMLQLTETVNPKKPMNYQVMADNKLAYYNRVRRSLSIKGAFGSIKVRAGSMVVTDLNLGDVKLTKEMIVDSVSHSFSNCEHTMDLVLKGDVITG